MKRSEELIKDFDDDMKNKIRSIAKDLASYENMTTEQVYSTMLFPQTYEKISADEVMKGMGLK